MAWTEDRVALLKKLWEGGKSGSHIARIMGNVTRNAVIGKAHRLGLTQTRDPKDPRRQKAQHRRRPAPKPKRKPVVPLKMAEDVKPLAADDLSVMTVKIGQCRWPVDRPNTVGLQFCGQPIDGPNKDGAKTSYCADHRALGTQTSRHYEGQGKWKKT